MYNTQFPLSLDIIAFSEIKIFETVKEKTYKNFVYVPEFGLMPVGDKGLKTLKAIDLFHTSVVTREEEWDGNNYKTDMPHLTWILH